MRRQLAQARAECEQRCHELQADLRDLQAVLDSRERQLREADKQKRAVVRELTDQNGRLQSHIREVRNHGVAFDYSKILYSVSYLWWGSSRIQRKEDDLKKNTNLLYPKKF